MNDPLLAISAKCRGNAPCLFEGQDMFLEIRITNNHDEQIGFPLGFVQKTGPTIRLVDLRTKAETYLRTNLASFDLREKFTQIQPGESVVLEWVITGDELKQFGGHNVDVSAEIIVVAGIQVSAKRIEFRGSNTLRIVSKQ